MGRCTVADSRISNNALQGVLARDGAELQVRSSTISGNGAHGMRASDTLAVDVEGCTITGNVAGSIALQESTVRADTGRLEVDNTLQGPVKLFE